MLLETAQAMLIFKENREEAERAGNEEKAAMYRGFESMTAAIGHIQKDITAIGTEVHRINMLVDDIERRSK